MKLLNTNKPQIPRSIPKRITIILCFISFFTPAFGQNGNGQLASSEGNSNQTSADDFIYTQVDYEAQFPGGTEVLKDYVKKNLIYPPDAKKQRITGKVVLRFVVRKDGSLTNVEVLQGGYLELNTEALRMISNMPKWIPARNGDLPVNSYSKLTLLFE